MFDQSKLKAALVSVQKGEINYENFLKGIASAGVTDYVVDIKAKKTIYIGYQKSYEESFPKPLCEMLGI
jgi:uncharacterized protein YbcV (DUF1398 family)